MKSKILSPKALKKTLTKLQKQKKKVVFTNGCFDILHRGHVTYLAQAKARGDILVVAVNSDASVKKLGKGQGRPVNNLKDRMAVIEALGCVDFVTSFNEDTPLKLITLLQPNVLVKGGDWKPEQIVGSKVVLASGGKVFSLPFVKGKSSTGILKQIQSL